MKDDLGWYQKYILDFLRNLDRGTTEAELTARFERLRAQLIPLTQRPYEQRAFVYFDIISWLESKIRRCTVEEVIREKVKSMFKNFLSCCYAFKVFCFGTTLYALFIFSLMKKRTARRTAKKIKKSQCFSAQNLRTPAWDFGPTR